MAVQTDLNIDVDQALRRIQELERALARSLAAGAAEGGQRIVRELERGESIRIPVQPRVDPAAAGRVTSDVTAAVDRADTTVSPTVDSGAEGRITSDVTAAVDNANTGVVPVVDPAAAARVTSTVENAIDQAGGTVTVTADVTGAGELRAACDQAKCVDDNLQAATDSADGLHGKVKALVAALLAAGAADFFRDAVLAAADLGEALSKNSVVFGEAAGEIEAWASDAATSMGLATDEALSLASGMGVLFQATGITAEESARLSADVIGLSGDLASFSNIQGGAQAAAEALSAALRGEAEPARALGIILNDEVIKRAAVRDGIAAQGSELNAQQKILATYSEIMRQTGLAQGDFARTADSLPNVLRTLQAEFRNTQVTIGNELLPDVIGFAQVIRSDGLPALQDLALSVVPALIAAMQGLLPLFTAGTQVLVAFAPTIEAIGLGLQEIPGPALAVAAAAVAIGRAWSVIGNLTVPSPATLGLVALGVAAAGVFAVLGQGAAEERAAQQRQQALATAIYETEAAYDDLVGALENYITTNAESSFADGGAIENLNKLGLTSEQVAEQLANGAAGFQQYLAALAAGEGIDLTAEQIAELAASLEETSGLSTITAASFAGLSSQSGELAARFLEQQRAAEGAAQAEADAALFAETLTQAQLDQALAATAAEDGSLSYARALEHVRTEQDRAGTSTFALGQEVDAMAARFADAAGLTDEQTQAIRELRGELDPFAASTQLTSEQMARLMAELEAGSLTTQEFADLADELGVSVEALAAAEVAATDSIEASLQAQRDAVQGWYDQLTQQIPGAEQAFADFNEEASIQEALDRFIMDSLAFAEAQGVLNSLLEGGFGELATFLATQPPAIIRQFADLSNEELARFNGLIESGNDILAAGAETAETNAGLLAGNVAGGFEDAATGIADADLPGAASTAIEDTGAAASAAAGTQQGSGAVGQAFAVGVNIGQALRNGLLLQEVSVILAGIRLGEAAIAGIRIGAQIRSPSRLAYDAGLQVALGYMSGFSDNLDQSVFAVGGVRTAGAVGSAATGRSGTVGATGAGAGAVTVLVDLDGRPFRAYTQQVVVGERAARATSDRLGSR